MVKCEYGWWSGLWDVTRGLCLRGPWCSSVIFYFLPKQNGMSKGKVVTAVISGWGKGKIKEGKKKGRKGWGKGGRKERRNTHRHFWGQERSTLIYFFFHYESLFIKHSNVLLFTVLVYHCFCSTLTQFHGSNNWFDCLLIILEAKVKVSVWQGF